MKKGNKAAFARPWSKIKQNPDAPEQISVPQSGMTLREYYAGQALQGFISNQEFLKNLNGNPELVVTGILEITDKLIDRLVNE